jgi:hypothetical protein
MANYGITCNRSLSVDARSLRARKERPRMIRTAGAVSVSDEMPIADQVTDRSNEWRELI